jgi:ABC-2 type transport system ATP-binding protein
MADRIGVIDKGSLVLVEDKKVLMTKLGKRQAKLFVKEPLREVPAALANWQLDLQEDGGALVYAFSGRRDEDGLGALLAALHEQGIELRDVQTRESSLEEIFVGLIGKS